MHYNNEASQWIKKLTLIDPQFKIKILVVLLTDSILCLIIFFGKFITITDNYFPSPNIDCCSYSQVTVFIKFLIHCSCLKIGEGEEEKEENLYTKSYISYFILKNVLRNFGLRNIFLYEIIFLYYIICLLLIHIFTQPAYSSKAYKDNLNIVNFVNYNYLQ